MREVQRVGSPGFSLELRLQGFRRERGVLLVGEVEEVCTEGEFIGVEKVVQFLLYPTCLSTDSLRQRIWLRGGERRFVVRVNVIY